MAVKAFVYNAVAVGGSGAESGARTFITLRNSTTPAVGYSDSGLTTPVANPQIADGDGRCGPIYVDDAVDVTFTVKTANLATTLLTVDLVDGIFGATYLQVDQLTFAEPDAVGDGADTDFLLTAVVVSSSYQLLVTVDGVLQPAASYDVSTNGTDSTVTFSQAPPSGSLIYFRTFTFQGLQGVAGNFADVDGFTVLSGATGEEYLPVRQGATNRRVRLNEAKTTATGSTFARAFEDRFAEVFNVKDYGALGDGSTDDEAAIDAAIADAVAAGGGVVYFPPGTYVAETVVISYNNITLAGAGRDHSKIKRKAATTLDLIYAQGTDSVRLSNIEIRDLGIEGLVAAGASTGTGATGHGIWIAYADYVRIVDVRVNKHNRTGFACISVRNARIYNCRGDGNWIGGYVSGYWTGSVSHYSQYVRIETSDFSSNVNDGFDFDFDVIDGSIENCELFNNDAESGGGDGDGGGIVVASDRSAYPCVRVQIIGNRTDKPIAMAGTQGFIILGNEVRDTEGSTTAAQTQFGHGIEIFSKTGQASCKDGLIAYNRVIRAGKYGIAVINWKATGTQDNITIGPNYIEDPSTETDNTWDGIFVDQYSRNIVIQPQRIVQATAGQMRYAINIEAGVTGRMEGRGILDAGATGTINNASSAFFIDRAENNQRNGVAATHTGNTTHTVLRSITIPRNAMGPNGYLEWDAVFSYTNVAAGNWTPRVYINGIAGTLLQGPTLTSASLTYRATGTVWNRNANNSQVAFLGGTGGISTSGSAAATAAVDTTADWTMDFTGQLANASDTVKLEAVAVKVHYGT
jgi:hypothetical protein